MVRPNRPAVIPWLLFSFFRPELKGHLSKAWKLMALWGKLDQPKRATPMDPSWLLAFAGTFVKWQWPQLACLTIVAFSGLLRTGEMFQLLWSSVILILPRKTGQAAILFLFKTTYKTEPV